MKHCFTLLALCYGIAASATTTADLLQAKPVPDFKQLSAAAISNAGKHVKVAPQRGAEAPGEVITEAQGLSMEMDLITSGFYVYQDVEYFQGMTSASEIVLGDDGYFYFKDIISMMPFGSYIRGEMDQDTGKIVVKLPQTVAFEADDDGDLWVDVTVMYTEDPEMPYPMAVEENNQITFSYNDDGSFSMDDLGEGYCIGLEMNPGGMWFGFSETSVSYSLPNDENKPNEKPDGLEGKYYSYITYGYGEYDLSRKPDFGYRVEVAIDNEDVYITGLSYDDANICIVGKLDGDKIVIPNNQYLGTLSGLYTCKVAFGHRDEAAYGGYALLPDDTVLTLNYNAEEGIIEEDGSGVVMFLNLTPNNNENGIYYLQMYENLKLVYQPDASGAPLAPWGLSYDNQFDNIGYGLFDFCLPVVNESGVVLERSNLYYNIFIDDEVFEFDTTDYNITRNMEDVPYLFNNNLIVSVKYGTVHELGIKVDGFDTIGVQCFNDYQGVVYAGPKATIDINTGEVTITTGVKGVAAEGKVESEKYYDLSGRRVINPANGIFVKRSTLENGDTTVEKVILK